MIFERTDWTKKDFDDLREYEKTIKGSARDCEWEKRIVNTKLECFARTSTKAKEVVRLIKKGAYLKFLENIKIENMFESLVCAHLIGTIKDFDVFERNLDKFVVTIDNWASADTLRFKKQSKEKLVELSHKYLKSDMPFVRRVGVNIWLELIKDEKHFDGAFDVLNSLADEAEYYVNMSAAWLLSFCMVYNREKTISYFKNNTTNSFIINKAISKCRDSFRISNEDKEMLKDFKVR